MPSLTWLTDDVPAVSERLRRVGLAVGPDDRVALGALDLRLAPSTADSPGGHGPLGAADRLADLDLHDSTSPAREESWAGGGPHAVAVGWATVDAQRAAAELGATVRGTAPDAALGAVAHLSPLPAPNLVVLEPSTEGRLAAALARHGEGPVAVYVAVEQRAWEALPDEVDERRDPLVIGPYQSSLGRAYLLRAGNRWGPFLLFVPLAEAP